jgi:hypothetical protein
MLGLLPGFGGTQRLPALIGILAYALNPRQAQTREPVNPQDENSSCVHTPPTPNPNLLTRGACRYAECYADVDDRGQQEGCAGQKAQARRHDLRRQSGSILLTSLKPPHPNPKPRSITLGVRGASLSSVLRWWRSRLRPGSSRYQSAGSLPGCMAWLRAPSRTIPSSATTSLEPLRSRSPQPLTPRPSPQTRWRRQEARGRLMPPITSTIVAHPKPFHPQTPSA